MDSQKKILLLIGVCLMVFGFFDPNISSILPVKNNTNTNYVIDAPADMNLLNNAQMIIDVLASSDASGKSNDCLRLSSLYYDMAVLIDLDASDVVIKDTASIRQANLLAGKMLRLDIKDKYPNLAETTNTLIVDAIGTDDVVLDKELRQKSVDAFKALSWSFYEGSR